MSGLKKCSRTQSAICIETEPPYMPNVLPVTQKRDLCYSDLALANSDPAMGF